MPFDLLPAASAVDYAALLRAPPGVLVPIARESKVLGHYTLLVARAMQTVQGERRARSNSIEVDIQ